MRIRKENWYKWLLPFSLLLVVLMGAVFFSGCIEHESATPEEISNEHVSKPVMPASQTSQKMLWTCPMHPQVKSEKQDGCPICGMNLVQMKNENVTKAQGSGCGNCETAKPKVVQEKQATEACPYEGS